MDSQAEAMTDSDKQHEDLRAQHSPYRESSLGRYVERLPLDSRPSRELHQIIRMLDRSWGVSDRDSRYRIGRLIGSVNEGTEMYPETGSSQEGSASDKAPE